MQYRAGRDSDFTHLQTFVWQAIFPAFDVAGLTDEQRAENDRTVEKARERVGKALTDPAAVIVTAWDERRRALAGYCLLRRRGADTATVDQLFVRRADWGTGIGETLIREATERVGAYRELLVALRPYNERAISFFEKLGFADTGEATSGTGPARRILARAGDGSAATDTADFPSADDEPHFEPVYAALPDYTLASEELSADPIFDPEQSTLDEQQLTELEQFIARAKAKKAGGAGPAPEKKSQVPTGDIPEPPLTRHPEITLEIDTGGEKPPVAPPTPGPLPFEFVFDREDPAPAPRRPENDEPPAPEPTPEPEDDPLELHDIPDPEPAISVSQLRSALEDRLGERLTAYFGADRLPSYLEVYWKADNYHRIRDAGLHGLARYLNNGASPVAKARRKATVLADLVEYFIVETARDLHGDRFPQRLLRYQAIDWTRVDLFQLVKDYLDFDAEEDVVYTDFVTIPPKVLKNATTQYLHGTRDERVFFICDQSLFGNGKTGFAFTDAALYWKNVLQPAGVVTFTTLRRVEPVGGHLLLDGQYFDAGGRLNLRVALLLDKLRRMDLPQ
ncbi:GNAT family N-acetyltransferase [Lewinella sp. IMCC34183]|uniref:GNAT family N-acetyltransferase n=1 Tax=Lewinella sp. IMCC34183 TaxID=2248762 RepID=UPI000E2689C7|nr:GNAT family N-acetyltransferase [Lewinella sp. IMCC34183]